jgi:hypothetical protein
MEYQAKPNSQQQFDRFGIELDQLLHRFLPNGSQSGCLKHKEEDMRQSAALLLFEGYLDNNQELRDAVSSGDPLHVEDQIKRSAWEAIKNCLLRHIRRDQIRTRNSNKLADVFIDSGDHQNDAWRRKQFQRLVRLAVSSRRISSRDAAILIDLVVRERSREEVAKGYGMTESGLSRIVSKAKTVLTQIAENVEMEM